MVAVSKKYVKREELLDAIDKLLEEYECISVRFPSNVEQFFLVKAWRRRPKRESRVNSKC